MKISKISAMLLLAILIPAISLAYSCTDLSIHGGHHDPRVATNVYVTIVEPTGTYSYSSGNIITTIGEHYDRDVIHFNNVTNSNATKWFSLGNATVASSLTNMTQEATTNGLTRALGTGVGWMNSTHYAANYTYTWTVSGLGTGNYIYVNATGAHWSGVSNSDGNLYSIAYITDGTQQQLMDTANVTVTWVWTRSDT